MFAGANSFAAGLDADHSYLSIFEKGMKQTDGVAPATDAGDKQIGETFLALENLPACFDTDDALKIADHHRVGMRAERRAQYIMSGAHVCDPIAHRFVDRFLERGLADSDGNNFRAQKFHPRDI